jgi:hypothetical protein
MASSSCDSARLSRHERSRDGNPTPDYLASSRGLADYPAQCAQLCSAATAVFPATHNHQTLTIDAGITDHHGRNFWAAAMSAVPGARRSFVHRVFMTTESLWLPLRSLRLLPMLLLGQRILGQRADPISLTGAAYVGSALTQSPAWSTTSDRATIET